MNEKTIVNGEYLNELLNILNKKGHDIEDIKDEILLPALKEFSINNQNSQVERINKIKTSITEIEKDIKDLTMKLEKIVIPGYEESNQTIKKLFNIDFHEEIDEFLKLINTK